jgi:hypothetical protein
LAQDGNFLGRAQAFAVDDTNAALAVVQASARKTGEQLARFIAVQAMQINFILSHPAAASQVAQYAAGQPNGRR